MWLNFFATYGDGTALEYVSAKDAIKQLHLEELVLLVVMEQALALLKSLAAVLGLDLFLKNFFLCEGT